MSQILFLKRRSSLIKFLVSWIPEFLWKFLFPETPRMHISPSLVQEICGLTQNFPTDDSNTSFCNFNTPQQMFNSTPKRDPGSENDKLKALQQQLDEIKQLVIKLVEMQYEQCSGYGTLSNPPDQLQKSFVPPPPPPPPPPPLPENFSLLPGSVSFPIKRNNGLNKKANQSGFPYGKELLNDLKKVKLKKIEKSPGGGPLKKPQTASNDPGSFLAAVLKKRFGRFQNSPESSLETDSVDSENSFISGTLSNRYEVGKNIESAVLSQ